MVLIMKNLKITVNGRIYDVQVEEVGSSAAAVSAPTVAAAPAAPAAAPVAAPAPAAAPTAAPAPAADLAGKEVIKSPMPGTIVKVLVAAGDTVKRGQVLVILEAMKMENEIQSPRDAVVASVAVRQGDSVNSGDPMVALS